MIMIDKSFKSPWYIKDEDIKDEVGDNHAINQIITITCGDIWWRAKIPHMGKPTAWRVVEKPCFVLIWYKTGHCSIFWPSFELTTIFKDASKWKVATQKEVDSLMTNGTWELNFFRKLQEYRMQMGILYPKWCIGPNYYVKNRLITKDIH